VPNIAARTITPSVQRRDDHGPDDRGGGVLDDALHCDHRGQKKQNSESNQVSPRTVALEEELALELRDVRWSELVVFDDC
jgi:hypothetical protein